MNNKNFCEEFSCGHTGYINTDIVMHDKYFLFVYTVNTIHRY